MPTCGSAGPSASEDDFAAGVEALVANEDTDRLCDLLREDHTIYDQRSTAALVRMRGWLLLAFARTGLPQSALIYVLEELDTGHDAYLVAAAARALRSSSPRPEFAPFLMQAISNMRYRDDAVTFASYGAYATSADATTPSRELLATLVWLGAHGNHVLAQLEALRASGSGVSRKLLPDLERAIASVRHLNSGVPAVDCCDLRASIGHALWWPFGDRAVTDAAVSC